MKDYELIMTCGACPEQYDVMLDGEKVAYLRLRHGMFRADVPDCGGETVYQASPKGDGMFEDNERDYYIHNALSAIEKHYDSKERFDKFKKDFDKYLAETSDEELLSHFPKQDPSYEENLEKFLGKQVRIHSGSDDGVFIITGILKKEGSGYCVREENAYCSFRLDSNPWLNESYFSECGVAEFILGNYD